MKVMITGASGQLGYELQKIAPKHYEIIALGHHDFDITCANDAKNKIFTLMPQLIINAAAYTAVDAAESEKDLAIAVNAAGAANLARSARDISARFIHISTDFIFDGSKGSPYLPDDEPNPLSSYGMSKWLGEKQVLAITENEALVIRTSWVYSTHGKNFVKTLLNLLKQREQLSVIADQVGSPTWARTLAAAIWRAAEKNDLHGIYHWSDAGVASWYDFAVAIQEEAIKQKLLAHSIPIHPISTSDYPLPAKRPAYSVMDKSTTWRDFAIVPMHWQHALKQMMMELTHA